MPASLVPKLPRPLRSFLLCLPLACSSLLGGCALTGEQQVEKSVSDTAGYRYIQLSNQLKVLLISDINATQAAVALNVNSGSSDDPDDVPGLAHFLEHMLFLGTERFPEVGSYQRFIRENGGIANAYTSAENTVYFFSVNDVALAPAMDQFADSFTAPLFDADYVTREIQAVESEYRKGLGEPGREIAEATQQLMVPGHPLAKFNVGSRQTLAVPDILGRLRAFHDSHYFASNMTLAVVDKRDLDTLQRLVEKYFSAIPAGRAQDIHRQVFSQLFSRKASEPGPYGTDTDSQQLPALLQVQSNRPLRSVRLTFELPDVRPHFRAKPLQYIADILGDEGPGSLARVLKQAGLVESLRAGVSLRHRGGSLFTVGINATQAGLEQPEAIAATVFAMIEKIREELQQQPSAAADRFVQMRELAATRFRFFPDRPPVDRALQAATHLQHFPVDSLLSAAYDYSEYRPELILDMLDYLQPENLLFTVASDQPLPGPSALSATKWYSAPYRIQPLQAVWPEGSAAISDTLALPLPSPFMPRDFKLHATEPRWQRAESAPELLQKTSRYQIWQRPDTGFGKPEANLRLLFLTDAVNRSAKQAALARLYVAMLSDSIEVMTYPAARSGVHAYVGASTRGIDVSLSGYSEPMPRLLDAVLEASLAFSPRDELYLRIRSQLQRQLKAAQAAIPYKRLSAELAPELISQSWSSKQLLDALETIDLNDVSRFAGTLWEDSYAVALVHGNVDTAFMERLGQRLQNMPLCECEHSLAAGLSVNELSPGLQRKSLSMDHDDAALLWYLQAPSTSQAERVQTALTAAILHPPFYRELRTEQQLGYVVAARNRTLYRRPGLALILQSPDRTSAEASAAVQRFIDQFLEQPPALAEFEKYRDSLIERLSIPDPSLAARTRRYWRELLDEGANFGQRQQMIAELHSLGYADWLVRLPRLLGREGASLLLVTD